MARRGVIGRMIGRLLGRRSAPQELCLKDPWIGVDGGNGFGGQKLLRSQQPLGVAAVPCTDLLRDVQLITRYCCIEQPYWAAFLRHYASLGVRLMHVCVQSEADEHVLRHMPTPDGLICEVHRFPASLTPAAALKTLDLQLLASRAPFTLLVDADEYLQPLRTDVSIEQLFALFPDVAQLFLPWLMHPLVDAADAQRLGFWGHIGKPLVRSNRMASIAFDHGFAVDDPQASHRQASAPVGLFGLALTHRWARSFRDCLLKTLFNRFEDAKSADCDRALALINAGELPIRLRLLAYLSLQQGYLPVLDGVAGQVEHDLEELILRRWISLEQEQLCRALFNRYRELLRSSLPHLPVYPATSLLVLAKLLPSLDALEEGQPG